jgi:hypothetical protein
MTVFDRFLGVADDLPSFSSSRSPSEEPSFSLSMASLSMKSAMAMALRCAAASAEVHATAREQQRSFLGCRCKPDAARVPIFFTESFVITRLLKQFSRSIKTRRQGKFKRFIVTVWHFIEL